MSESADRPLRVSLGQLGCGAVPCHGRPPPSRKQSRGKSHMTTASGHTSAISARKVIDTDVFDPSGKKIGEVKDVVLDKTSNNIMFAIVGFGGLRASARNITRYLGANLTIKKAARDTL